MKINSRDEKIEAPNKELLELAEKFAASFSDGMGLNGGSNVDIINLSPEDRAVIKGLFDKGEG